MAGAIHLSDTHDMRVAEQVYMLTLDTLQWAILDPHPLGFPAPAIHGHTTVEDPARVGRLIVFGGQGGNNWNTQVGLLCGLS